MSIATGFSGRTVFSDRSIYTALFLSFGLANAACAVQRQTMARAPSHAELAPAESAKTDASGSVNGAPSARRVGDYSVHMISGSFRKHPALLTERVTGEEYGRWVIEYRLEDSDGSTLLRVWMNQDSDQVEKVSRVVDGVEKPATVADYDALMAAASVVPDTNEGLLTNSTGTCTLGPSELDCETKKYKVWLGDREAQLGVTRSAAVPATDLAGEITAADGTVIYRSELVEHGNGEPTSESFALR
jgi:hypothetical protein